MSEIVSSNTQQNNYSAVESYIKFNSKQDLRDAIEFTNVRENYNMQSNSSRRTEDFLRSQSNQFIRSYISLLTRSKFFVAFQYRDHGFINIFDFDSPYSRDDILHNFRSTTFKVEYVNIPYNMNAPSESIIVVCFKRYRGDDYLTASFSLADFYKFISPQYKFGIDI